MAQIAKRLDATIAQVTLAYLMQLEGMGPLIPSASTVAQLEENAAAAQLSLDAAALAELRQVFTVV